MTFYLKGLLVSLGGVALFYVTLYAVGMVRMLYAAAQDVNVRAPLHATAGDPLLGYVKFLLWAAIVFSGTFLAYLRVMSSRPLH